MRHSTMHNNTNLGLTPEKEKYNIKLKKEQKKASSSIVEKIKMGM
jgi:hypothetical protein